MTERLCGFEGCGREHAARGYCHSHWNQLRKVGRVSAIRPLMVGVDLQDKLDRCSDKSGACHLWKLALTSKGYGRVTVNGRQMFAHRASYELAFGPIPDGMHIDHACHVRSCVNPDHLAAVTPKQNNENLKGARVDSSTGIRGVRWNKQARKYQVSVRHNRHVYHGGFFHDLEEAAARAVELRNELFSNNRGDRR